MKKQTRKRAKENAQEIHIDAETRTFTNTEFSRIPEEFWKKESHNIYTNDL